MKKFLALGDSYTIGEGVPPEERWPVRLARLLRGEGIAVASPRILATTGWTTGELMAGIREASLEPGYDLVSLLIGVNNQYRGWSLQIYRREFADLLEQATAFARGVPQRVVVLSIPDWSVTPFAEADPRGRAAIAREIEAFNAANREETLKRGAHYVDITPLSRQHGEKWLASDGLHPSGEMYRAWAEQVLPVAREILYTEH